MSLISADYNNNAHEEMWIHNDQITVAFAFFFLHVETLFKNLVRWGITMWNANQSIKQLEIVLGFFSNQIFADFKKLFFDYMV